MSEITREGLKKISYAFGQSHNKITSFLGDLNKNPGAIINLEAMLCKMRGSTFFYNEDYSASRYPAPSDPSVIETFNFVKFSSSDIINFGIQGAHLSKNYNASVMSFPTITGMATWNPSYYGPPCTEGFGTWYYNAWKGYEKEPPSPTFENSNYSTRYDYEYPIRYVNTPTPYVRVAFFEHARWISIYNDDVTARGANDYVYVFELDKSYLYGTQLVDVETDLPLDVRFMYYSKLLQKYESSNWQAIDINLNSNYELSYLAHTIEDSGDTYTIKINIPNDLVFDPTVGIGGADHYPSTWWHIIMFWGSKDSKAQDDLVTFNSSPTEYVLNTNEYLVWNAKHFFIEKVNSKLTWENLAINDSSTYSLTGTSYRYLIAKNRVHFELKDGTPSQLPIENPYKYILDNDILSETANYSNNSISNNVSDLKIDEFQSAILMVKTYGATATQTLNQYKGYTTFNLKLGPKFSSQESRSDWENFGYFPQPDVDYTTFAKLILKRASPKSYGSIESNYINSLINSVIDPFNVNQTTILQNSEILWIEQVPPSFAVKPHGDPLISANLVPALYNTVLNFRFNLQTSGITNAAAKLLLLASRTPSNLANSVSSLLNTASFGSIIFRRLLKNPVDPLLQPATDEPLAIQFTAEERKVLEGITSLAPSTEILRLNSDNLFLLNNKLNFANTFEIFHEPSDQCTAADNQNSGAGVGLDYNLRMKLEDADENVLIKDWYIMASKYLLTQEEFNNRIEKEQSTIGYFTFDTLNNIDQWRLQGYASIVPDLTMGSHRVLTTRFVNPPDSTQETEAQFRAKYEAQGRTQEEIDELVLRYLESGGQFYEENLFQYNNKFTTIREAALNITTFTEGIPYWQSNIENFNKVGEEDPSPPIEGFYSDSFTLSLQGASGADLEAFGKQSATIYSFTFSSSIVDLTLDNNSTAFKFNSGNGGRITTIGMKLKADLFDAADLILSNQGLIKLQLFSNSNTGSPDNLLAESSSNINYQTLEDGTYKEFYWDIEYNLDASTIYWVNLLLDSSPQGGDIKVSTQTPYDFSQRLLEFQAFSFTALADTNSFSCSLPISVVLSDSNTTDGLTNLTGTLDFQIYSANSDGSIGELLAFTSANSSIDYTDLKSYQIIFNFDASINLDRASKYWILLIPSERQRGGTIVADLTSINLNAGLFSQNTIDNGNYTLWDNWDGVNYKPWMKVTKIIPEIYGYFNRDQDYLDAYLPGPNLNRITNALLSKESSWAFSIKKFPEPSRVYIYPRYSPGYYVPFFRNIYVHIRLLVGGSIKDYRIHLDPTDTPVVPISINDASELAEGIVYMYIAKTNKELDNGFHGAPGGDRLIIRSS
jgi:hypothetical protein